MCGVVLGAVDVGGADGARLRGRVAVAQGGLAGRERAARGGGVVSGDGVGSARQVTLVYLC